jgi:prepilin-type N-terminal cleavage/methylation domain-containing protein
MNIKINKSKKGFTLLEVLLVIALMTILFAISLVAINPRKQLAQARNLQRKSDIDIIYKALEYYKVSQKSYPTGITGEPKAICIDGNTPSNCVDLSSLVPEYLADIPTDPSGVAYQIYINSTNGVIGVEAAGSELGQSIVVNPIPIITSTPTPTPTPAPTIVQNGLILHLDAGNTASYPGSGTTWTSLSGNGNNGTLTNLYGSTIDIPTYSNSNGGSLVFDGINELVTHGNVTSLNFGTGSFTVDFWMRPIAWGDGYSRGIADKKPNDGTSGWTIYNDGGQPSKINARLGAENNFFSSTSVVTNTWQHWTLVRNGSTLYWYYNATQDSIGTNSANLTNTTSFYIGRSQTWSGTFSGNISVVAIYNRALSTSEITQNHDVLKSRYGL